MIHRLLEKLNQFLDGDSMAKSLQRRLKRIPFENCSCADGMVSKDEKCTECDYNVVTPIEFVKREVKK